MILKKQTCKIAGLDIDEGLFKTEKKIKSEETNALLAVIILCITWYFKLRMTTREQKNRLKKKKPKKTQKKKEEEKETTETKAWYNGERLTRNIWNCKF